MSRSKLAVVDATSRSLPYDYWYVRSLQQYFDVDVYVSKQSANTEYLAELASLSNVNLIFTGMARKYPAASVWRYLRMIARFVWNTDRYSAVNIQWSVFPFLDVMLLPLLRKRLVITIHNPVPHEFKGQAYWPHRWFSRIARRVIFVSDFSREDFVVRYRPTKQEKLLVLKHGAMPLLPTLSQQKDLPLSEEAEPKRKELIFWGRVEPYKGVDFFLKLLRSEFGRGFSVRIIGRWDKSLAGIKSQLLAEGAEIDDDYVSFGEVLRQFGRGAVFVLPYRDASQSGVFYNLIFHRPTLVATDVGDIGRFVRQAGHEHLLFDADCVETFVNAYRYARENQGSIQRDFRALVEEQYSWNYPIDLLEEAFSLSRVSA